MPLSDRAVEVLRTRKALIDPNDGEFIFPGERRGHPLSSMALLMLLRRMGVAVTAHGFRSTFRDWAGDNTTFPREVAEAALAHTLKDKTEAAYRRETALKKRRQLMDAWAQFLSSAAGNAKVVSLPKPG